MAAMENLKTRRPIRVRKRCKKKYLLVIFIFTTLKMYVRYQTLIIRYVQITFRLTQHLGPFDVLGFVGLNRFCEKV